MADEKNNEGIFLRFNWANKKVTTRRTSATSTTAPTLASEATITQPLPTNVSNEETSPSTSSNESSSAPNISRGRGRRVRYNARTKSPEDVSIDKLKVYSHMRGVKVPVNDTQTSDTDSDAEMIPKVSGSGVSRCSNGSVNIPKVSPRTRGSRSALNAGDLENVRQSKTRTKSARKKSVPKSRKGGKTTGSQATGKVATAPLPDAPQIPELRPDKSNDMTIEVPDTSSPHSQTTDESSESQTDESSDTSSSSSSSDSQTDQSSGTPPSDPDESPDQLSLDACPELVSDDDTISATSATSSPLLSFPPQLSLSLPPWSQMDRYVLSEMDRERMVEILLIYRLKCKRDYPGFSLDFRNQLAAKGLEGLLRAVVFRRVGRIARNDFEGLVARERIKLWELVDKTFRYRE
ncbi:hypothetical protein TWF506_006372 [Arthrobotrys conoides]|uniref:Uncharacterized protein n=1 Tax=Arthrobotrys conoides TaxID=74498 RepID=A0AAN8S0W3_9PEZI